MTIKQLNPYLFFYGNADKAIALYERALGAKVESVIRHGDVPGADASSKNKNGVVHAQLRIGDSVFMLSDGMGDTPPAATGNVHVALDFSDADDLTLKFEALASGGKVLMPPHDTFYGGKMGVLTDAYGIRWMFNCMTR